MKPIRLSSSYLIVGACLLSAQLFGQNVPDSERVNSLLSEAKTEAYQLRQDAAMLENFCREPVSWQAHAGVVNTMRVHINDTAKTVGKLDEERGTASPWQVIAIDRIKPLMEELTANTANVIHSINKSPDLISKEQYRDYVEATSDLASQLSGMISSFVDYGNTKNRLERLTQKLELPASATN